jgi:mycothiol system anti-sigma-R factor
MSMKHEDRLDEISAYIDGELAPDDMTAMREHLASCEECAAEYEMLRGVSRRVKEGFERPRAPDALRTRIQGSMQRDAAAPTPRPRAMPWATLIAAGFIIAVASSAATLAVARGGDPSTHVADEVLASHIRSLMPGHLTDVTSNDSHNVKPWFNGRLDLSPAVPRLDSLGFPLVGGRLDYTNGRPVAAVVYQRRQHVINVFSWPVATNGSTRRETSDEKGYHLVHWRRDGMEYWVASDVSSADLSQFVDLFTRTDGASKEP